MQEVFSAVLEQPPHARDAFLRNACADDGALLKEVAHLLEVYQDLEPGEFSASDDPPPSDLIGALVGPYRVLRLLGAGGMGHVYLASRADGAFERSVAVKVVSPGETTDELIARFEDECRILASLQHPCIATLLDAGRLPDQRFYFVMEYVDGLPITTYCDKHGLDVRARVKVLQQVCEAVSLAHRNLIVHRDLKPGNILVDTDGTPKLLDFGIAKVLTRSGLEASLPTNPLLKRATPAYASPEQLQGEPVHTGMDVFALGVILHELLTGIRPQSVSVGEVTTTNQGVFQKPSLVASSDELQNIPGRQAVSPHDVDADLDAIILRSIQSDSRKRYGSVDDLSRDLRAWLDHYPVEARRGSAFYRTGKFLRRNRLQSALAALAGVALVVALVSVIGLWRTARREQALATERFEASRALAGLLFAADESLARVRGTTETRQAIAQSITLYLNRLRAQAAGDSRLMFDIAEGYRRLGDVMGNPNGSNLGERPKALEHYEQARTILDQLRQADPGSADLAFALARTRVSTGNVLAAQAAYADATKAFEEALALTDRLARDHPGDVRYPTLAAGIHRPLGDIALAQGRTQDALTSFEKALGIEESLSQRDGNSPERQRLIALSRLRIADARAKQGAWREAQEQYAAAISTLRSLVESGDRQPGIARNLAVGLLRQASVTGMTDRQAAEGQVLDALNRLRELLKSDAADARARRDLLAGLVQYGDLIRARDFEGARKAYREAKDNAVTLRAEMGDPQSERDLEIVTERLAAGPTPTRPELTLYAVVNGRRQMLKPGDPIPLNASRLAVSATAPDRWSRYLVLFGAEGAASILDESQLAKTNWTFEIAGPPPAQTILLVALPHELSDADRQRLSSEISGVPGPRAIDWDSQVVWASGEEPTIVSDVTSRGRPNTDWVKLVIAKLGGVKGGAFTGRTIPIAPPR